MNKSELVAEVEEIADAYGIEKGDVLTVVNIFLDVLASSLTVQGVAKIANFGKFEISERKPTTRRNPQNGEPIYCEAKRGILFKPSPALRNRVNGIKGSRSDIEVD